MSSSNFVQFGSHPSEEYIPLKMGSKLREIDNNSATLCLSMLKFDMLAQCWTFEVAVLLKSPSDKIQDSGRPQNFQSLNRYNSAVDCSISLKFGTEFDYYVTVDTMHVFKVKGSKVKIAW